MERHAKEVEALLPHTKKMPPLKVGNSVRIQNQTGNAPRRWDNSGQVVEVRKNDQYAIKVHGSGIVTSLSNSSHPPMSTAIRRKAVPTPYHG